MPDVRDLIIGATTVGANYEKFQINTSDAGREIIVRVHRDGTALTTANALAAYRQLTQAYGAGDGVAVLEQTAQHGDAGTFAAFGTATGTRVVDVDGTLKVQTIAADGSFETGVDVTEVFIRLQTTGFPNYDEIVVAGNNVKFVEIAVFQAAK